MKPKDMTDEQLRIKVAELLNTARPYTVDGNRHIDSPDYPNDLNACHEAFLSLDPLKQHSFKCVLGRMFESCSGQPGADADVDHGYFDGQCATARQRCIAFVEVMSK